MSRIRIAVVGVGNCASALLRGIWAYEGQTEEANGIMTWDVGGYNVSDIDPVCAFDVDDRKVGVDIGQAIKANNDYEFADVPDFVDCPVYRGPVFDGVADHMEEGDRDTFRIDRDSDAVDVATTLDDHDVDVLVNYLPVGSQKAVSHYASACLEAGVGLVNAMPVFVASDPEWSQRFESAGVPVVGDDIKSQVGATVLHQRLVELLEERGVELENTYQLNVGGNSDFRNMLDRDRLASKKVSKTEAVNDKLGEELDDENIHVGPSDHVEWLEDTKLAFIRLDGRKFGGTPVQIEVKLDVQDSANSAGAAVDAIRSVKAASDAGHSGSLDAVSAYTMKHPPVQMDDATARAEMADVYD